MIYDFRWMLVSDARFSLNQQLSTLNQPSPNLTAACRPGTARAAANENKTPAPIRIAPGQTARGVAATCPAWDRTNAGAIPAALTNFLSSAFRVRLPHSRLDAVDKSGTLNVESRTVGWFPCRIKSP